MIRAGAFSRFRVEEERGAIAVVMMLLIVVIFTLLALVLDLAAMRSDARASQATGDFASMAGALALEPTTGGNPYGACVAAYQYFLANTQGLKSPPSASTACAPFSSVTFCDPLVTRQAIVTVAPYRVTITQPVSDGSPLMQGRLDESIDGAACQRIAVQVQRTRAFLFGGLLNAKQGTTEPPAVARATAGHQIDGFASLVLLDPTGCNALYTSGQGNVWVRGKGVNPGMITVDSNATYMGSGKRSCANTSQSFAIDASGNTQGKILAGGTSIADCSVPDGLIMEYALMPGGNNAQAFDPVDPPPMACHVVPRPIAGYRITRAPVDYRYDCKTSYPTFQGLTIPDCKDTATRPPYITNLRTAIGTSGVPSGFTQLPNTYIDQTKPAKCATASSTTTIVIPPPPSGYSGWYVRCTHLVIKQPVIFQRAAGAAVNLLFDGTVDVAGGTLCVNVLTCTDTLGTSPYDGYIYFRAGDAGGEGDFLKGSNTPTMNLMRTMVYLDHGFIDFGAGNGFLSWIAPTSGNFDDLALWSESALAHRLGGQANLKIEGTFFTPYATPFNYDGQGDQFQPRAQFITYDMNLSGQGTLTMEPDPERTTPIPLTGVLLIR